MKDYYRILQVYPEAESEVITAAYKRLMRKYHPDLLLPELRDDPETLQKAKDINEAYEILSSPAKRTIYDRKLKQKEQAQRAASSPGKTQVKTGGKEHAFLYVRCGQTKEIFKALLVRNSNSDEPYQIMGFEPVPVLPPPKTKSIYGKAKSFFKRKSTRSISKIPSFAELDALTDDDLHKRLKKPDFTMGDIDWGWHKCPACQGMIQNDNGTFATWIGCSKCGRIRCAGAVEETRRGRFSTCPWCGKRNKLTRSVKPGSVDHLQLHGLEKNREIIEPTDEFFDDTSSPDLLEKGRTN
ncbi:J domain-containing protein [Candidatus Leptofilum sp.]|uniref:J domain-containing protein n=1 Tax=Candidatus Leptofilum sp. TaxID=3241576 RepID=UPI003B5AB8FB